MNSEYALMVFNLMHPPLPHKAVNRITAYMQLAELSTTLAGLSNYSPNDE